MCVCGGSAKSPKSSYKSVEEKKGRLKGLKQEIRIKVVETALTHATDPPKNIHAYSLPPSLVAHSCLLFIVVGICRRMCERKYIYSFKSHICCLFASAPNALLPFQTKKRKTFQFAMMSIAFFEFSTASNAEHFIRSLVSILPSVLPTK